MKTRPLSHISLFNAEFTCVNNTFYQHWLSFVIIRLSCFNIKPKHRLNTKDSCDKLSAHPFVLLREYSNTFIF